MLILTIGIGMMGSAYNNLAKRDFEINFLGRIYLDNILFNFLHY